jgi:DNA-binding CsgD family transcriptional regulator
MVLGNTLDAARLLGRTTTARQLLDTYRTGIMDGSPQYPHRFNEAVLDVLEGDVAEAKTILAAMLDEVIPGSDRELCWTALSLEAGLWAGDDPVALRDTGLHTLRQLLLSRNSDQLGELLRMVAWATAESGQGDALAELRRLAEESGALTEHPGRGLALGYADTFEAELSRVSGLPSERLWAGAAQTWSQFGCRHFEGYARWRRAEALLAARRRKDAEEQLQAAMRLSAGHAPQSHQIAGLARRARLILDPQVHVTRSSDGPHGLTARELEVLELLTIGLTNAQIGSRLFMSPKTASVHVTSILRKLDVNGRVQAAALAEREGLVRGAAD